MLEMLPKQLPHHTVGHLPNNVNGHRTTHTCELCGFEPKTKNKYREKQDHLVMKHFKEKIDKIFPHCRPYACPTPECGFTGKDKQALLRHYTGKHGILEKYLREALAAKGLPYDRDISGSKRKHSSNHDSNGGTKAKKLQATLQNQQHSNHLPPHTTIIDTRDMLPKSPVPVITQNGNHGNGIITQTTNLVGQNGNNQTTATNITFQSNKNSEELRKEVEAMMASFQPQPQQDVVTTTQGPPQHVISNGNGGAGSIKVTCVPSLPTAPVPVSMVTSPQGDRIVTTAQPLPLPPAASIVAHADHADKQKVILSSKLPNHALTLHQPQHNSQPPSSIVSLIKRSEAENNGIQVSSVGKSIVSSNSGPTLVQSSNGGPTFVTATANGGQTQIIMTNGSGNLVTRPNGQTIHIPELILPQGADTNGLHAIPIEVIATVAGTNGQEIMVNGNNQVVENEEVMWGAGSTLGPAVVVETVPDTVPVTYIEASEIVYSAASLDNIDYDYLYPVTTSATSNVVTTEAVLRNSAVRERQLEFNML